MCACCHLAHSRAESERQHKEGLHCATVHCCAAAHHPVCDATIQNSLDADIGQLHNGLGSKILAVDVLSWRRKGDNLWFIRIYRSFLVIAHLCSTEGVRGIHARSTLPVEPAGRRSLHESRLPASPAYRAMRSSALTCLRAMNSVHGYCCLASSSSWGGIGADTPGRKLLPGWHQQQRLDGHQAGVS